LKKLFSLIIILLLCISFVPLNPIIKVGEAIPEPATIVVPDDYPTIQDAINAANPGDTIIISEGIYAEGQINVHKSLTILTNGTVIVDGLMEGHVFYITANKVTINGFTVKNSKPEWPYSGIYLYYVQNSNVTGNTIINNYGGIGLDRSYGNHITGNEVANSKWIGVRLVDDSDRNYVTENNITHNMIGMVLYWSGRNPLSNNHLASNEHNLGVVGRALSHFVQDIDTSNTVNGKQVYYLLNKSGFVIEPSTFPNAGYLALVNSTNIVTRNLTLANNGAGVLLAYTTNSTIEEIKAINNSVGISLISSDGNNIVKNNLTSNDVGIYLYSSSTNMIYHNNFNNNTIQNVYNELSNNTWDVGYPSGGNYWSDYTGMDEKSGSYQNITGSDGIRDDAYVIDENNRDPYPLAAPINIFDAGTWNDVSYSVDVVSNSTSSDFHFNPDEGAFLRFNVTDEDGTAGFCRVTVPKDLLWVEDGWTVLVGGESVNYTIIQDENYTYLYFAYNHSTKTVQIIGTHVIPEFPQPIIQLLFASATLIVTVLLKRKRKPKPQPLS